MKAPSPGAAIVPKRAGDWWYVAGGALPKAIQWHVWYEHFSDRIARAQPVEKFLIDATTKLQQTLVKTAQRVRANPEWARRFTEEEMASIKDVAAEAASWYARNRPDETRIRNCDPVLLLLFQGLDGAYAVMERLAMELDFIGRKGYVMVDPSAECMEVTGTAGSVTLG